MTDKTDDAVVNDADADVVLRILGDMVVKMVELDSVTPERALLPAMTLWARSWGALWPRPWALA